MDHRTGRRQRWAWLLAGWSAVTACCLCGMNWLWVTAGAFAAAGIAWIWDRHGTEDGWAVEISVQMGQGKILLHSLLLAWAVIALAWTGTLADLAFPTVDGFPELGWVLLAMTAWGVVRGPKVCARCGGVLCLFLLVLYGAVGVFAAPDLRWSYLHPTGSWQQGIWTLGLCLLPVAVFYLPGRRKDSRPLGWLGWIPPLMSGILALVTAGVLSPQLAEEELVPLYSLAQSVSLFGVMERMEPLLSAAMTMGVFSLLTILASLCQSLADQLRPWKWSGTMCCIVAAGLMPAVKNLSWTLLSIGNLLLCALIPGTLWIRRHNRME